MQSCVNALVSHFDFVIEMRVSILIFLVLRVHSTYRFESCASHRGMNAMKKHIRKIVFVLVMLGVFVSLFGFAPSQPTCNAMCDCQANPYCSPYCPNRPECCPPGNPLCPCKPPMQPPPPVE